MPDEQYLTLQQIAQRLQLSEKTVRRWVTEKDADKRLPSLYVNRRYRIKESDLHAFLQKHSK